MTTQQHVTNHTRAGKRGKMLECPHCHHTWNAGHFAWSGFQCVKCITMVDKQDWLIAPVLVLDKEAMRRVAAGLPAKYSADMTDAEYNEYLKTLDFESCG